MIHLVRSIGLMAALASVFLPVAAQARQQSDRPGACDLSNRAYEDAGYIVRTIRVVPVVDVFGVVQHYLDRELAAAQAALDPHGQGLHQGAPFKTVEGYFALQVALADRLGMLSEGERFTGAWITPALEACDRTASPPSLDVVYRAFALQPLSYATSVFEKRFDRPDRFLVPAIVRDRLSEAVPAPVVGYNASRGLFAGGDFARRLPMTVFDRIDASLTGSTNSATGEVALSGSRDLTGVLAHVDWRGGVLYSNLPAESLRLENSSWIGQFAAATRPLRSNVVLRFGGAIERGVAQSSVAGVRVPVGDPADDHRVAKLYAGGTLNRGRQAWSASYGLQVGTDAAEWRADHRKQVVDAVYNGRFLPREHRPLTVDARVSAGRISASNTAIPVIERFFGGNTATEFIRGDTWRINSAPIIRSFPQNRFGGIAVSVPGAASFVSANLTVGQTVWNRPAIPSDVRRDADFNVQFESAILALRNSAIAVDARESDAATSAAALADSRFTPSLKQLAEALERMAAGGFPEDVMSLLSDARDTVDEARDAASAGRIVQLLVGLAGADPLLTTIQDALAELARQLPSGQTVCRTICSSSPAARA
jgi:hypothetical protein